jgi:hypothetical protein
MKTCHVSRRSFLAAVGTTPLAFQALAAERAKKIPIGIQMYSVRDDEKRDLMGTLKGLREMGYECVEFWAPYFDWTVARAKEVRKQLDDLGLRCYSNHTATKHFADEHLPHAIELNHILGSRYVIMAHAGPQKDLDGWRRTAEVLANTAPEAQAGQPRLRISQLGCRFSSDRRHAADRYPHGQYAERKLRFNSTWRLASPRAPIRSRTSRRTPDASKRITSRTGRTIHRRNIACCSARGSGVGKSCSKSPRQWAALNTI